MTLSWNLGSLVAYTAEEELAAAVEFSVPEDATYYLVGALYTTALAYIEGTMFGVLIPTGEDYGVNSPGDQTEWEMVEDEEKELDCKLTLDRTNVILGLFLMKQLGDEPAWTTDTVINSVTTSLSGAEVPAPGLDIGSLIMMVMVVGMMGMMMRSAFK